MDYIAICQVPVALVNLVWHEARNAGVYRAAEQSPLILLAFPLALRIAPTEIPHRPPHTSYVFALLIMLTIY